MSSSAWTSSRPPVRVMPFIDAVGAVDCSRADVRRWGSPRVRRAVQREAAGDQWRCLDVPSKKMKELNRKGA